MRNLKIFVLMALVLAGCGGGGASTFVGWQSGAYQPEANFAALCAAPRTGIDPITNVAYPDKAGSLLDENNWLRSWTNDLYLWFDEVADQNPANFSSTAAYFDVLKTTAVTSSGAPKDKFHFTYTTAKWEALSQSGTQAGYGPQWAVLAVAPPRNIVIAYLEPAASGTTATDPSLARGGEVLTVDGVDAVNGNTQAVVDALNAGLFPVSAGESHTFSVRDVSGLIHSVTLVSADVVSTPVMNVKAIPVTGGTVGYMLFNNHLATSEAALVSAFTTLKTDGVTDLVLDIRYNGGGYLDIASEVAYMIAGPGPTTGQTFELTQFNSKHPTVDPVTGRTITPVPFHATTQGFSTTCGQPLPTLNLLRVFVLTGPDTCSASEAIINSLRGVGLEVDEFGSTTCGKPYGFYPQDNCGTTYFSIEFQDVNQLGVGGYTDGFSPQNEPIPSGSSGFVGVSLPGCSVADDFGHALGDPAEGRLAVALAYQGGNFNCPTPATGFGPSLLTGVPPGGAQGVLQASPLRALRLLRH